MKFVVVDDDDIENEIPKKEFLDTFKEELDYLKSLEENGIEHKVICRSFVVNNRLGKDGKVFHIEVINTTEVDK